METTQTPVNATSDRMAVEAARNVGAIVQDVVDELTETHAGRHPDQIVTAVQQGWSAKVGPARPALDAHKAAEYATHISKGNRVTIVPVDGAGQPLHLRPAA